VLATTPQPGLPCAAPSRPSSIREQQNKHADTATSPNHRRARRLYHLAILTTVEQNMPPRTFAVARPLPKAQNHGLEAPKGLNVCVPNRRDMLAPDGGLTARECAAGTWSLVSPTCR
jgi:hypothetical protein